MARPRAFDEEAVLDAAIALFWQNCFQRTSMTDLADAAGVQRGSLCHAYKDKETLFLKAFDSYANRFLTEAEEALKTGALRERLTSFFGVATANMLTGKPPKGCLTTRVFMEIADENEAARQALQGLLTRLEDLIETALADGKLEGQFEGDARQVARLLVAMTRGMAVIERTYGNEDRPRQIANETVRLVVRAV